MTCHEMSERPHAGHQDQLQSGRCRPDRAQGVRRGTAPEYLRSADQRHRRTPRAAPGAARGAPASGELHRGQPRAGTTSCREVDPVSSPSTRRWPSTRGSSRSLEAHRASDIPVFWRVPCSAHGPVLRRPRPDGHRTLRIADPQPSLPPRHQACGLLRHRRLPEAQRQAPGGGRWRSAPLPRRSPLTGAGVTWTTRCPGSPLPWGRFAEDAAARGSGRRPPGFPAGGWYTAPPRSRKENPCRNDARGRWGPMR